MRQAQWLLSCGANDFGGTLINESISTAAGAAHGQLQTPAALRRAIRDAGRVPVERSTRYDVLRAFPREPAPPTSDAPARRRRAIRTRPSAATTGSRETSASGSGCRSPRRELLRDRRAGRRRTRSARSRRRPRAGPRARAAAQWAAKLSSRPKHVGIAVGRGEGERVGVVAEVVAHEGDVVIVEGRRAGRATSARSMRGRSAMRTTAGAAPRDATSASARSTTSRERSRAVGRAGR